MLQTNPPETGEKNLQEALVDGHPALVWADLFSLSYHALAPDEKWWDMQPAELALLGEARQIKDFRRQLFLEQGIAAREDLSQINIRLNALRDEAAEHFPPLRPASCGLPRRSARTCAGHACQRERGSRAISRDAAGFTLRFVKPACGRLTRALRAPS